MAGRYHYSNPIGQGMSNLAEAISSAPIKQAEYGLLQKRQQMIDEQMLTEASQRENYAAQTRLHGAQAADWELKTMGRRGAGDAFSRYGSSGAIGGSAAETAQAPTPAEADLAATITTG